MEPWYNHLLPEEYMKVTAKKGYIIDKLATLWI